MAVTASGKGMALRYTRVYLGGYDISGDARTIGTLLCSFGEADTHGISDAAYNYLRDGRMVAGVDGLQALMNDTALSGASTILNAFGNQNVSVCLGNGGEPAVTDLAYLMPAAQFGNDGSFDSAVGVLQANFRPLAGTLNTTSGNPLGVVLRGPSTLSATVAASSSVSHDNGASTANGWHAMIHVLSSSSGNFAFEIQDSADDSAFSTLGSFTVDGSTVTSEYISGTGTVEQYVALDATRTAGSCVVVVTFARG